jgi:septum formation protein
MEAAPESRTIRVHLASRSPRRRELLREFGVVHSAEHPGIEDSTLEPGAVSPEQWVAALAYLKASAGLEDLERRGEAPPPLVMGADTACVKDGKLFGTPATRDEARVMLRSLREGEHDVVTGVALLDPRRRRRTMLVDRAKVRLGALSDDAIDRYVDSDAWQGKAGGYNLRERLDAGWPLTFQGDHTTIMGLPMRKLARVLVKLETDQPRPGNAA